MKVGHATVQPTPSAAPPPPEPVPVQSPAPLAATRTAASDHDSPMRLPPLPPRNCRHRHAAADQENRAAAPKAIPTLRKMVALVEELQATRPLGTAEGQERAQLLALLSALGDKDAGETLKKMGQSPSAAEAATGRSAQIVARWMRSDADAAVQQKIVDDLQSLARQYPTQDAVTAAAVMLAGTAKPEAKALRQ